MPWIFLNTNSKFDQLCIAKRLATQLCRPSIFFCMRRIWNMYLVFPQELESFREFCSRTAAFLSSFFSCMHDEKHRRPIAGMEAGGREGEEGAFIYTKKFIQLCCNQTISHYQNQIHIQCHIIRSRIPRCQIHNISLLDPEYHIIRIRSTIPHYQIHNIILSDPNSERCRTRTSRVPADCSQAAHKDKWPFPRNNNHTRITYS